MQNSYTRALIELPTTLLVLYSTPPNQGTVESIVKLRFTAATSFPQIGLNEHNVNCKPTKPRFTADVFLPTNYAVNRNFAVLGIKWAVNHPKMNSCILTPVTEIATHTHAIYGTYHQNFDGQYFDHIRSLIMKLNSDWRCF